MEHENTKIPRWYWVVAIFFLIWNLMGLSSFFMHVSISEEEIATFSKPEQELYRSFPLWTIVIFAIAVFGGFIGSVGLMMKKKWSNLMFLISLAAIIPQMIYNIFFSKAIDVYGPSSVVMPVMVVVFGALVLMFSKFATGKKWLV